MKEQRNLTRKKSKEVIYNISIEPEPAMKDDVFLLCTLKIDYFYLYPVEDEERIKIRAKEKKSFDF